MGNVNENMLSAFQDPFVHMCYVLFFIMVIFVYVYNIAIINPDMTSSSYSLVVHQETDKMNMYFAIFFGLFSLSPIFFSLKQATTLKIGT